MLSTLISKSKFTIFDTDGQELEAQIDSLLGSGKFEIYKITLQGSEFAMKVFPVSHKLFENESQFTCLKSEYLASPIVSTSGYFIDADNSKNKVNVILSEYCSNGDLFSVLIEKKIALDEKLARTYFRHMVQGIEAMHTLDMAHLDLKLENLFLSKDFKLKVGDFDLSYKKGRKILTQGSPDSRAPELIMKKITDPAKADVFSMGIILFALIRGTTLPFSENTQGLYKLLQRDPAGYWKFMNEKVMHSETDLWSQDFKELFEGMVKYDPKERFGIEEIKKTAWYNGEIYEDSELIDLMKAKFESQ